MIEYADENLNKAYVDADRIVQLIPAERLPERTWIILDDGRGIESCTSMEVLRDRINQQKQINLKAVNIRVQAAINASQKELAECLLRAFERSLRRGA